MTEITSSAPAVPDGRPQSRLYLYYLMSLLLAVNIFNFIDRQIPFILAESIKRDLNLTDTQIGVLGGFAFAVVYSTLGIPLGRLSDRFGSKWVLSGSLVVWSLLTAMGGLAQNFYQLVATRIGVAAGEAGSTPAAHSLIASFFPPDKRSLPLAFFSLGVPLGTMIGLMLGGWINQVASWREALILIGLPGVLLALIVAWTIPSQSRAAKAERAKSDVPLLSSLKLLWGRKTFRQMSYAIAVYSMGANAAIVFTPAFLMRSHEMGSALTGMSLGLIYGVAGVAGVLMGGVVGDLLGKRDPRWRMWAPALALALAAPFTLAAWFVPSATASVLLIAAPKFANLLYFGPVFVALQSIAPSSMRATASAFLIFFNSLIGVSFGPLVTGLLSDGLEPMFGVHSLRYALCFVVVTQIWAAWHFFLAARTLRQEAEATARVEAAL